MEENTGKKSTTTKRGAPNKARAGNKKAPKIAAAKKPAGGYSWSSSTANGACGGYSSWVDAPNKTTKRSPHESLSGFLEEILRRAADRERGTNVDWLIFQHSGESDYGWGSGGRTNAQKSEQDSTKPPTSSNTSAAKKAVKKAGKKAVKKTSAKPARVVEKTGGTRSSRKPG